MLRYNPLNPLYILKYKIGHEDVSRHERNQIICLIFRVAMKCSHPTLWRFRFFKIDGGKHDINKFSKNKRSMQGYLGTRTHWYLYNGILYQLDRQQ